MKESRSTSKVTTSWDKRLYFSSDESVINYDEKITTFITIRNLQSCFTAPVNRGSEDRILWVLLTDKWYYNQRWWFSFLLINLGFGPFPARLQSGYETFSDVDWFSYHVLTMVFSISFCLRAPFDPIETLVSKVVRLKAKKQHPNMWPEIHQKRFKKVQTRHIGIH